MDEKKTLVLCLFTLSMISPVVGGVSSFNYNSAVDGSYWNYGNTVEFEFSISATQGDLDVIREGTVVKQYSHPGSSSTYSLTKTYDAEKDVSWYVEYQGDDGTSETFATQDIFIRNDAYFADITQNNPDDGATLDVNTVDYEFSMSGEPGSLDLYSDTCSASGELIYEDTYGGSSSQTYTTSEDFSSCSGDFDWYIQYTGDDGSTETTFSDRFTIESDASAASVTYNSPNDGENFDGDINQEASITYDFDFTGDTGDLYLREDGVQIASWSHSGGSGVNYDYTVTNDDGTYDWNVEYDADDGSSESFNLQSYEIEDYADRASLSQTSPNDGASLNSRTVDFEYGNSGGGDGDVKLYVDGNLEATKSYTEGASETYTTTVDVGGGDHTWYVEYVGDDGSSTSTSTDSFSTPTDAEQTTISNDNPADGASFTGLDSTIDYQGSVSGNSGTVRIYSDTCSASGTQIYSESYGGSSSTTFGTSKTYDCEGTFDWYVEYEGDDGSTKTTASDSFSITSDASSTSVSMDDPVDGSTVQSPTGDVEFNYSASGESGTLYVYVDGSQVNTDVYDGSSSQTFSYTETLNGGDHTWQLKYQGGDGTWDNQSVNSFTVENDASNTSFEYLNPSDGFSTKDTSIDFRFNITGEAGDIELFVDGTGRKSWTHPGNEQKYSYNVSDLSVGNHSWYVEYTGSDGSVATGSTYSFEILESEGPSITYQDSTSSGTQINDWILVNVSVTDSSGVDTVLEEFNGTNSTFQTNQGDYYWTNHTGLSTGNYSFQVWANDTLDNSAQSGTRSVEIVENRPTKISIVDPDNITYTEDNVPVDVLTTEPDGQDYSCDIKDSNQGVLATVNQSTQTFKDTLSQGVNGSFSLRVDCEDERGLKSNESISYSINTTQSTEESDGSTGGTGGGGGGGSGSASSKAVTFIQRREVLQVAFGTTGEGRFSATNRLDQELNVNVSVPDSPECRYFELQRPGLDGYSDSVEYNLPADAPLTGNDFEQNIGFRFDMPMKEDLRSRGSSSFSCELSASSDAGEVERLILNVDGTDSSFALFISEVNDFVADNPWQSGMFVFVLVMVPVAAVRFL